MEHLIEGTGVDRVPEIPGELRRTVGRTAQDDDAPNPEIGGTGTEGDRRGTAIGTRTATENVIEIGTESDGSDPTAEDAGKETAAGLPGPAQPKKLMIPSNRHGGHPEDLPRSRGWLLRPGRVTTAPLARRQPRWRWFRGTLRSVMEEPAPSCRHQVIGMPIPSERTTSRPTTVRRQRRAERLGSEQSTRVLSMLIMRK